MGGRRVGSMTSPIHLDPFFNMSFSIGFCNHLVFHNFWMLSLFLHDFFALARMVVIFMCGSHAFDRPKRDEKDSLLRI